MTAPSAPKEDLRAQLTAAQARVAELEMELANKQTDLANVVAERDDLERRRAFLSDGIATLMRANVELRTRAERAEGDGGIS